MLTGYYERGVSAAMTITNASSSFTGSKSGRTLKFTPQAVEKIKELVAQGVRREEIAKLLDVTVGSLQVTCSRLGISLRRLGIHKAPALDSNGRTFPPFRWLAGTQLQAVEKGQQSSARFVITVRRKGVEGAVDLPLSQQAIERLGIEAAFRDMGLVELMAQVVGGAVKKDVVEQILNEEAPLRY
jgi:hypothetical protein